MTFIESLMAKARFNDDKKEKEQSVTASLTLSVTTSTGAHVNLDAYGYGHTRASAAEDLEKALNELFETFGNVEALPDTASIDPDLDTQFEAIAAALGTHKVYKDDLTVAIAQTIIRSQEGLMVPSVSDIKGCSIIASHILSTVFGTDTDQRVFPVAAPKVSIIDARKALAAAFTEDPEFKYVYVSNIAMRVFDAAVQCKYDLSLAKDANLFAEELLDFLFIKE